MKEEAQEQNEKLPEQPGIDSKRIGGILNHLLNKVPLTANTQQDVGIAPAWVDAQGIAIALRDGELQITEVK